MITRYHTKGSYQRIIPIQQTMESKITINVPFSYRIFHEENHHNRRFQILEPIETKLYRVRKHQFDNGEFLTKTLEIYREPYIIKNFEAGEIFKDIIFHSDNNFMNCRRNNGNEIKITCYFVFRTLADENNEFREYTLILSENEEGNGDVNRDVNRDVNIGGDNVNIGGEN